MKQVIPPNVEVVNGHWLCFGEPDGSVSLFTPGEGFWGFWLPEADARRTAQVVCGGLCIECGCETRHHDNEAAACDRCQTCPGLVSECQRASTSVSDGTAEVVTAEGFCSHSQNGF
jgi:hypothetical protein